MVTPVEDLVEYLLRMEIPIQAASTISGLQLIVANMMRVGVLNRPLNPAQVTGLIKAAQQAQNIGLKTTVTKLTTGGFKSRYFIPGKAGFFGSVKALRYALQNILT